MKREDALTFEQSKKGRSPDRRVADDATFVFLGCSGSGKDTQLELLTARYKPHLIISTGDLLRALAKSRGPFGKRTREIFAVGGLHPSWLASSLWLIKLIKELKEGQHLFTTGALRRVEEAKLFDEVMEYLGRRKPIAIYLVVSEEEATRRLLKRGRKVDTSETIKGLFQYFREDVLPVAEHFRAKGRLIEVDGELSIEELHAAIIKALKEFEKEK